MNIVRNKIRELGMSERLRALDGAVLRGSFARAAISRLQADSAKVDALFEAANPYEFDQYTIATLGLMTSIGQSLGKHAHDPAVKAFLDECLAFHQENITHLMVESAISEMASSRDRAAYKAAIEGARKAANDPTPDFAVAEGLGGSSWVPQVKALMAHSSARIGKSDSGAFYVQPVYSVVETLEGRNVFFSDGLVLETDGKTIGLYDPAKGGVEPRTAYLQQVLERSSFDGKELKYFPNSRTELKYDLEKKLVTVNGSPADLETLAVRTMSSGAVRLNEADEVQHFISLVTECDKIAHIDFATRVMPKTGKQQAATVFVLEGEGNVFVQIRDKGMGRNSLETFGIDESVDAVKKFINYDISESLRGARSATPTEVVELDAAAREKRIAAIEEQLANVSATAIKLKVSDPARVEAATAMLNEELAKERAALQAVLEKRTQTGKIPDGVGHRMSPQADDADGFVPGKVVHPFGPYKAGDRVQVNAVEFSSGSNEVTVYDASGNVKARRGDVKIDD